MAMKTFQPPKHHLFSVEGGLNLAGQVALHDKGWSSIMTDGQQSTKTARAERDEEMSSDNRSSMSPIENGTARVMRDETEPLDDQGTSQEEAAEILQILRDQLFDGSDEAFALALGRTSKEVKAWFSGNEPVDADVLLKARGIAIERGAESLLPDQQEA